MRPKHINLCKQRFQPRRVPTHRPLHPGTAYRAERAGHVQGENRTRRSNVRGRSFKAWLGAPEGGAEGELCGAHRLYNLTFISRHDRLECHLPEGRGQEQRAQSSLFLLQSLAKQLVHTH